MDLRLGDIVLIEMQFHETQGAKVRPALVVLDSGDDDFVAVPITSRSPSATFDLALSNWQLAGLNVPSTVRLHKATVLSKSSIRRSVGRAVGPDLALIINGLCRAYCPAPEGSVQR